MKVNERVIEMLVDWAEEDDVWSLLTYMSPEDFVFPFKQHPVLLILLDCVRWEASKNAGRAVPVVITADWRKNDDKTHGDGPGVDIRARTSSDRYYLLAAAYEVGFTRIGIYCDDMHIHLGIGDLVETDKKFDPFVCWVRKCS